MTHAKIEENSSLFLISVISSCLSYSLLCVMVYESESIISFLCCFPCFSWIAFIYFCLCYFYSPSLLLCSFRLSSHLQLSPMCNPISQAASLWSELCFFNHYIFYLSRALLCIFLYVSFCCPPSILPTLHPTRAILQIPLFIVATI